jgi:predicted Zn-dependent protease
MAAGRYAEAVPVYRALTKALPGNPGLLLNLGMALHLSGQDREALAPLEAALKGQPDLFPAALFLGIANMSLGRASGAVAPLDKAVRLDPGNREARSMLVDALVSLGRNTEAEPHLVRLSRTAPKDPAVWFALGKTYEAIAGSALGDLLRESPDSTQALSLVAEARLDQGQTTAAFRLYRQALERSPGRRGLHAAIAEIYRRSGQPEWAAVAEGREAALPRPDCARDTLECAFAPGKYRDVVSAASREKTPESRYWLARASSRLAIDAFERLSALPPSAQSHEWAATQRRNEGRHAEAEEEWRRAIALAPDETGLKVELAATLRARQDLAGAQSLLEEVLRREPDFAEAYYLLGDVLLARQQPEAAIAPLERAARGAPDLLEARAALGRAYALVGRPGDAVPHLEAALATDTDGSLRLQLARAYQGVGEAEKARSAMAAYQAFRQSRAGDEGAGTGITPP